MSENVKEPTLPIETLSADNAYKVANKMQGRVHTFPDGKTAVLFKGPHGPERIYLGDALPSGYVSDKLPEDVVVDNTTNDSVATVANQLEDAPSSAELREFHTTEDVGLNAPPVDVEPAVETTEKVEEKPAPAPRKAPVKKTTPRVVKRSNKKEN